MRTSWPGIEGRHSVAAALPFVVLTAAACTGSGERAALPFDAGAADARTASLPAWKPAVPPLREADAAPRPGDADEPKNEPENDAGNGDAGKPRRPPCFPSAAADVPDDDFADTNCDGIDGDAASAVFVAPGGSDDGDGSMAAPVRVLSLAIALAQKLHKPAVYACVGTYAENLLIAAPIELYGGFDCERGWQRVHDVAVVRPEGGVALKVFEAKVRAHRMAFQSGPAKTAGESSIAVSIFGSEGVEFDRVDVMAGDGGAGVPGVTPAHRWEPIRVAAPGRSAESSNSCSANRSCTALSSASASNPACRLVSLGGDGEPSRCPAGEAVRGGAGGQGSNCGLGILASSGVDGVPAFGSTSAERNGDRGASGEPGAAFGRIDHGEYVPTFGGAGGWGKPGLSGRGGDGTTGATSNGDVTFYFYTGGGGGQGGYAGCGGPGGGGGGGGGASIAVIAEGSKLRLSRSRIVTGKGGDGGAPANGVLGQPGGAGAPGAIVGDARYNGSPGTAGGNGGQGGSGGPGAGGPTIGIVYVGDAPEVDDSTLYELGEPGKGAIGATAAPDGISKEMFTQRWEVAK